VFLEHARQLGPTLRDVAWEKAGVVTADTEWLCRHPQSEVVEQTLAEVLPARVEVRLFARDFGQSIRVDGNWLEASYPEATYCLRLPHTVGFMRENALVALDAARTIWQKLRPGKPIPTVIDLSRLRLPGRLEVVATNPLTVVDGTIHECSARYLAEWVAEQRRTGRVEQVGVVLSIPADKDGEGVVRQLAGVSDWLLFTKAHNHNLAYDRRFFAYAQSLSVDAEEAPYLEDALPRALERLQGAGVLVLAGTQSFVGDVLRWYGKNPLSIWNDR
jgi:dihydrofolate synthase/folylpolyglutamate synthase